MILTVVSLKAVFPCSDNLTVSSLTAGLPCTDGPKTYRTCPHWHHSRGNPSLHSFWHSSSTYPTIIYNAICQVIKFNPWTIASLFQTILACTSTRGPSFRFHQGPCHFVIRLPMNYAHYQILWTITDGPTTNSGHRNPPRQ